MPDDDSELIKAGAQGIVEGAMKPFSDLIQSLFGPAAAEAGLMLKDSVQHYRHMRRIRLFERTQELLANARIKPGHVSLKLLIPIIENASNEEEDNLQDVWANLLANAANSEEENKVYPSFPTILRDLTGRDVKFLDALYLFTLELSTITQEKQKIEDVRLSLRQVFQVYSSAGLSRHPLRPHVTNRVAELRNIESNTSDAKLSLDAFGRHEIFVKGLVMPMREGSAKSYSLATYYSFSRLGASFVKACSDPSSRLP